jgi:hypothetical protein
MNGSGDRALCQIFTNPKVVNREGYAPLFWSRIGICAVVIVTFSALSGCAAQTDSTRDTRPFFQKEYGLNTHGRKTWFDHLVETDPGGIKATIAPDYEQNAPLTIAVLPFADLGRADYILDDIPITHRNEEQRNRWAWTDANRARRAIAGYLAEREFVQLNLIQVDAILKRHGILNEKQLKAVAPQELGQWLGVQGVVYGEVTSYEAYYAGLIAAWRVGDHIKMVSTRTGEVLVDARGSRISDDVRPAFDPFDIALNSGLALLELRDVTLARAEEEDAREITLRIPRSERLQKELIESADTENETLATRIDGYTNGSGDKKSLAGIGPAD